MAQDEQKSVRGKATVLAIGTAVPPNIIYQSDYPDYYFRVTKSEHLTELKQKLTRICTGTKIRKRHFYLTNEMLNDHPNLITHKEPSLDLRNVLLPPAVTMLAKDAAEEALREWGQPRSRITHFIFHTSSSSVKLPGLDYELVKLLGLEPTVNRNMIYFTGCYASATLLRLAKDLAENNPGARVLAVCSETTLRFFRGPSETCMDTLVAQSLFGDGAGAVIVGSDPDMSIERPLYEILSTGQSFIPGTDDALGGILSEAGVFMYVAPSVPMHITNNIKKCVSKAFQPLGISDWNSLFWIVHPGGRKILDGIETELQLEKEKLLPTRHVLAEFGNMASGSVIFVMAEMRNRSRKEGKATTGDGAEFGVLLGFGPGITIEAAVLRALPIPI
ncbi:stilbene synthase 4-like [Carex rostrata]